MPTGILVKLNDKLFALFRRSMGKPINAFAEEKTVRNIKTNFRVDAKASTVPSETPVLSEVFVRWLINTRN